MKLGTFQGLCGNLGPETEIQLDLNGWRFDFQVRAAADSKNETMLLLGEKFGPNEKMMVIGERPAPIPMLLNCPECGRRHIDRAEFALKPHHTHSCQTCGMTWRPAVVDTVGVQFLPGFKDEENPR